MTEKLNHEVDSVTQSNPSINPVIKSPLDNTHILKECADVFEGLGYLEGAYHTEIDPFVEPVIHPTRQVPVTLREPLRKELERMVKEEIWTPESGPTDWVSSMVTVIKPTKLRICIDPKDLKRAIKRSHYPIPTIEEAATKLNNAKIFSVLEAKSGFWQVNLDDASCKLTTLTLLTGASAGCAGPLRQLEDKMSNGIGMKTTRKPLKK